MRVTVAVRSLDDGLALAAAPPPLELVLDGAGAGAGTGAGAGAGALAVAPAGGTAAWPSGSRVGVTRWRGDGASGLAAEALLDGAPGAVGAGDAAPRPDSRGRLSSAVGMDGRTSTWYCPGGGGGGGGMVLLGSRRAPIVALGTGDDWQRRWNSSWI